MNTLPKNIIKESILRYNKRLEKYGPDDPRSLGWSNAKDQNLRFSQISKFIDLNNKIILDIGCGFGDFKNFLFSQNIFLKKYIGWDINENFINIAKEKNKDSEFYVKNLYLFKKKNTIADVGVMLGLLNYNLKNTEKNYEYSKKMICKAFDLVKKSLIVDFISSHRSKSYPKESFIFYHDPSKVLEIISKISNNFLVIHDYRPLPQKEFFIIINK